MTPCFSIFIPVWNEAGWLPGAIVSLLLIAAILYFVDLRAMLDAMRTANYSLLLIAFVLFAPGGVCGRLLRQRA